MTSDSPGICALQSLVVHSSVQPRLRTIKVMRGTGKRETGKPRAFFSLCISCRTWSDLGRLFPQSFQVAFPWPLVLSSHVHAGDLRKPSADLCHSVSLMGLYCESNISPLCYPNLGHVEDACSCLRVLWLLSSSFISLTNPCIKTYWYLIP